MTKTLIAGGRVLRQDGSADAADVLVEGATIAAIAPPGAVTCEDAKRLDARDRLLIPASSTGTRTGTAGSARARWGTGCRSRCSCRRAGRSTAAARWRTSGSARR